MRTGELALAEFAADLHEVTLAQGHRPVYEDPEKFFALTYPTHALRELVKDVAGRLAGRSDKAVRQLELTYGGGKTHTLITLYHLFRDPSGLPDLPAVREFREHVGADLPAAFTAALCFDKIDAERGIEDVRGTGRRDARAAPPVERCWRSSLPARDGLRALHADGADAERETPPAEPLLVALLEKPRRPRPGDADPGRRGADVRPREGGPRSGLARADRGFLPVPDAGCRKGGHGGHGRFIARH